MAVDPGVASIVSTAVSVICAGGVGGWVAYLRRGDSLRKREEREQTQRERAQEETLLTERRQITAEYRLEVASLRQEIAASKQLASHETTALRAELSASKEAASAEASTLRHRISELEAEVAILRRSESLNASALAASEEREKVKQQSLEQELQRGTLLASRNHELELRSTSLKGEINSLLLRLAKLEKRPLEEIALPPAVGSGILRVDMDGSVIDADSGAVAIYGGRIDGKSVLDLMPARFRGEHLDGFSRAVRGELLDVLAHEHRLLLLRADDSELPIVATIRQEAVNGSAPCFVMEFGVEASPSGE